MRKYNPLPLFIEVAKSAIKEKVVRVIISFIKVALFSFKNLLEKASSENMVALLGNRVFTLCETLVVRKWSDPEILEDLEFVKEELSKNMAMLR